ncbi:hypothetical protein [Paracoccus mutanolyticus]|uniref:hypothetical protein n=1 Tax=Paracoccus mutanolyticus TaxID=1499308 RepID=UPI001676FD32|nr:hypothetical protein [Paracoccus mutanolyticus]
MERVGRIFVAHHLLAHSLDLTVARRLDVVKDIGRVVHRRIDAAGAQFKNAAAIIAPVIPTRNQIMAIRN